jgi:DNA-directed RNA polymerase specialized sigma54-like protein
VARRTITKYRALMRMPSVDVRRAEVRMNELGHR